MADGMFDSGGGSDGGGGLIGGVLVELPWWLALPLLVAFIAFSVYSCQQEEKERELDKTVYVETSRDNFDRWVQVQTYEVDETTLWFEEGSSHRGSYHCKGGQFRSGDKQTTFCCSVEVNATPACMEL